MVSVAMVSVAESDSVPNVVDVPSLSVPVPLIVSVPVPVPVDDTVVVPGVVLVVESVPSVSESVADEPVVLTSSPVQPERRRRALRPMPRDPDTCRFIFVALLAVVRSGGGRLDVGVVALAQHFGGSVAGVSGATRTFRPGYHPCGGRRSAALEENAGMGVLSARSRAGIAL
jgi:hypothetical protein